jgi:hypothetical protein
MIYAVIGRIGYGKTAYLTYRLLQHTNNGEIVYSNYKIKHSNAKPLNINHLDEVFKLERTAIALDEAGQYFDARRSTAKTNLLFSYLLNQSRKRKMDIFLAAQRFKDYDIRLRVNYQILVYVYPMKVTPKGKLRRARIDEIYDAEVDFILFKEFDIEGFPFRHGLIDMRKIGKLYDTFYYYDIGLTEAGKTMSADKKRKIKKDIDIE